MLFLYHPRQTWMPYSLPRDHTQQAEYNRLLQERYTSTRRVRPSPPTATPTDTVAALTEIGALHRRGDLTDEEFVAAKTELLNRDDQR